MAITRQQKSEILSQLKEKMARGQAAVFVSYRGTSCKDLTDLRRELYKRGMDFQIVKKTLLKKASEEANGVIIDSDLGNVPFGVVLGYDDQVSACKVSVDFAKKIETLEVIGGIVDGKLMDVAGIMQYATLPSREESLAKFSGLLRAPLTQFHGAVKGSLSSFARAVSAYSETKSA